MELWDLYDNQRNLVGHSQVRGEVIPAGCYHLVVHVWIRNRNGEFLISQRSKNRQLNPLLWECVGGSVLMGENSLEGALREVLEEVGVDLSQSSGRLLSSRLRENYYDILDTWLFEYDGPVSLKNATTDEVLQVKWMSASQIHKLFESGQMVDTLKYFFDEVCMF